MVITETGARNLVAKALPVFDVKLTSNPIRVPVPNGSLEILNLEVQSATTVNRVNNIKKKDALEAEMVEQIKYSLDNELVASNIVGTPEPTIFDTKATIATEDRKNIVLNIWYDNE